MATLKLIKWWSHLWKLISVKFSSSPALEEILGTKTRLNDQKFSSWVPAVFHFWTFQGSLFVNPYNFVKGSACFNYTQYDEIGEYPYNHLKVHFIQSHDSSSCVQRDSNFLDRSCILDHTCVSSSSCDNHVLPIPWFCNLNVKFRRVAI